MCDLIDERHQAIVPAHVWGDGDPEGVRQRAAREMQDTARAAARFGVKTVTGFTGSSIWHAVYAFPPTSQAYIDKRLRRLRARAGGRSSTRSKRNDVNFALEVHPTEIAFDIASAQRAIEAVQGHRRFGFNFDPSHLAYQGVDYVTLHPHLRRPHLQRAHEGRVVGQGRRHGRACSAATPASAMRAATGTSAASAAA